MSVTTGQLVELYLAYFGRPPDVAGVGFYTTGNSTLDEVMRGFNASPESVALHGGTFGPAQINAIYQNLFNRDAEPAGLAFWQAAVSEGRITPAQAALAILHGAQNADKIAVQHKLALSAAVLAELDTAPEIAGYAGDGAAALARTYLKTVDASDASLAAALAVLQTQVAVITGLTPVKPPAAPAPPSFAVTKSAGDIVSFVDAGTQVSVTESGGIYTFTSSGGVAGTGTATGTIVGIVVPTGTTLSISSTLASGKAFTGTGTALVVANPAGENLTAFAATGVDGFQLTAAQAYTLTAAQAAIGRVGASGAAGTLAGATVTVSDTLAALAGGVATTLKTNGATSVVATALANADISAIDTSQVDSIVLPAGNYTMTAAQAAVADGTTGSQVVTVTTQASGTLKATVESFVLGDFANNVTLGAAGQGISSPIGAATATTLTIGGMTVSGTWSLGNSGDTLVATNGANIASVNGGSGTTAERLTLAGTITMTALQYGGLNNANLVAGGSNDSIIFTTLLTGEVLNAAVEGFVLVAGENTANLGANGQTINAQALAGGTALTLAGGFSATVTLDAGNLSAGSASGNLTVTAGTAGNTIITGSGNDTVNAGDGVNRITGGAGIDTLNGGNAADTFFYASMADFMSADALIDLVIAGAGADTVEIAGPIMLTTGSNLAGMTSVAQITTSQAVSAQAHSIVINNDFFLNGVSTIDLSADTNSTSTALLDFTGVFGGMTLKGVGAGVNTITGGSGSDTLFGGSGNDYFLFGSAAEAAADTVVANGGTDTVLFRSILSETLVVDNHFSAGMSYQITTGSTTAVDASTSAENIDASTHSLGGVKLTGNAGANTLTGTAFADTLAGGGGADTVRGGAGNDIINTVAGGNTTFVFEATASANGDDQLKGISSNSKFKFSDFLVTEVSMLNAAVDANSTTARLDLTGGDHIGVRYNTSSLSTANIVTSFTSGVAGQVVVAEYHKAVVFSSSANAGIQDANGRIYYVEGADDVNGNHAFSVTLVGTVTLSTLSVTSLAASGAGVFI